MNLIYSVSFKIKGSIVFCEFFFGEKKYSLNANSLLARTGIIETSLSQEQKIAFARKLFIEHESSRKRRRSQA